MDIEDGLSNNSINSILQTRDGFLWIATKDGLNRYDGQGFKVFKFNFNDPGSLPENYVMSLIESRDGTFWVGTWGGGLCSYDPVNENFIQHRVTGSRDDYIQCLFEDHAGNIWFGTTEGGLFRQIKGSGEFKNFPARSTTMSALKSNNIGALNEDTQGRLWVGSLDSGLFVFNPIDSTFTQYSHTKGDPRTIADNRISDIFKDNDSIFYLSTFSGVDKINIFSGEVTHNPGINSQFRQNLSSNFRQVIRDRKGRLWFGNYDYHGLYLVAKDETGIEKTYRFISEDNNPGSLTTDRIRYIYEDKKGNIWIGTETGLNKLPVHQPFSQYRHLPLRPNSLGGRVVSTIYSDKSGFLWVGLVGGGFDKIDRKTGSIRHFQNIPGNANSLSDNDVSSFIFDKSGIMWISTMNGGLNRYDPITGKFKSYKPEAANPKSISSAWVHQVLETQDGLFLVGTNSGLNVFNRAEETFHLFSPETIAGQKNLPSTISVNVLFEDSHNNIWIGTWLDGLFCYNPLKKTIDQYLHKDGDPQSISSNKITCIFEDRKGKLWFGTHSGGFNSFDAKSGIFYHYNTQTGLPNDVVFGILQDSEGNMWVSTMKGLVKMNPESGKARVYDELDGLVDNQFNWRAGYQDGEGRMYFGGINGFVSFFPDSIKVDTVPPQVAITSFKIFNKTKAPERSVSPHKIVELDHNQNFFSIEFTALDMAPNQKHNYAYMLQGIDPDWVYSGSRTTAFYTDLHHGVFSFLAKACNADGIWSEPVSIQIVILPAWWNTWWVKLLGLLAIFGIGILVARIRLLHLLEIERIRLNIASDLHDEMGSNLSSISVDSQQLMRSSQDNKKIYELASDIYKTTNETIDSIRDIIWFINPKNDGGENTLFKMREKAATMLAGIQWSFEANGDVHLDTIKLEVRRNIFLIYKEVLTNVVRHSNAKKCEISLIKQENKLLINIADNGNGFDPAGQRRHGGIENIYYRAKKINADVEIKSDEGKGTIVALKIGM